MAYKHKHRTSIRVDIYISVVWTLWFVEYGYGVRLYMLWIVCIVYSVFYCATVNVFALMLWIFLSLLIVCTNFSIFQQYNREIHLSTNMHDEHCTILYIRCTYCIQFMQVQCTTQKQYRNKIFAEKKGTQHSIDDWFLTRARD